MENSGYKDKLMKTCLIITILLFGIVLPASAANENNVSDMRFEAATNVAYGEHEKQVLDEVIYTSAQVDAAYRTVQKQVRVGCPQAQGQNGHRYH